MWRILYVEDSIESYELMAFLLENANGSYQVHGAQTADEAITLISSGGYDLYILDRYIPGMDGAALCRWIRETGSKSPVVFYSGAVRDADKALAFDAGANEYLEKPEDLFRVVTVVEDLLLQNQVSDFQTPDSDNRACPTTALQFDKV